MPGSYSSFTTAVRVSILQMWKQIQGDEISYPKVLYCSGKSSHSKLSAVSTVPHLVRISVCCSFSYHLNGQVIIITLESIIEEILEDKLTVDNCFSWASEGVVFISTTLLLCIKCWFFLNELY